MRVGEILSRYLQHVYPDFVIADGLPTLPINPFGPRGDEQGRKEFFERLSRENKKYKLGFKKYGGAFSLTTPAASPHTPEMIKIQDVNNQEVQIPAHLIVWWGKVGERVDFLSLSRMNKEERKNIFSLIEGGIRSAWQFLYDRLPEEYKNDPTKVLEIYGLVGHATKEERKATGLSRGAQSNPEGHINICFHPYDKYRKQVEKRGINAADFLKHVGPMDTILMKNWGDFFKQIIGLLLKESDVKVSLQTNHESYKNLISFYEGATIKFEKPCGLNEALEVIAKVVGFYDQIYERLKQGFENYWKNIANEDEKSKVVKQLKMFLFEKLEQLGVKDLNDCSMQVDELIDFTLSFKPTYQQLTNWEQDKNIDESSRGIISQLKNKYEKIRKGLKSMTNEKKRVFIERVARFYGVSLVVAESLVLMIENQIADPSEGEDWEKIRFTFPNQISLSWMIEEYEIDDNGEILVKKITIAPRFMTEKGAFEDMGGMKVERSQGK